MRSAPQARCFCAQPKHIAEHGGRTERINPGSEPLLLDLGIEHALLDTGDRHVRVREYVCAENNLDPARYQEYLKRPSLFMRSPDQSPR